MKKREKIEMVLGEEVVILFSKKKKKSNEFFRGVEEVWVFLFLRGEKSDVLGITTRGKERRVRIWGFFFFFWGEIKFLFSVEIRGKDA